MKKSTSCKFVKVILNYTIELNSQRVTGYFIPCLVVVLFQLFFVCYFHFDWGKRNQIIKTKTIEVGVFSWREGVVGQWVKCFRKEYTE